MNGSYCENEKKIVGDRGGCERRIEVIVKMQKKSGVRWGVQSVEGSGYMCTKN